MFRSISGVLPDRFCICGLSFEKSSSKNAGLPSSDAGPSQNLRILMNFDIMSTNFEESSVWLDEFRGIEGLGTELHAEDFYSNSVW